MKTIKRYIALLITFVFLFSSVPLVDVFAYPDTEEEFYQYIASTGQKTLSVQSKPVNFNTYRNYGLIVYGNPWGDCEWSPTTNNNEYRYLGYTQTDQYYTNSRFPNDARGNKTPLEWTYEDINGAAKTWGILDTELKNHMQNSSLSFEGTEYSSLKVSSSLLSINKAKLLSSASFKNGFSIYTMHKGNDGKPYYATLTGKPMAGSNILSCSVTTPSSSYTIKADESSISVPVTVTGSVALSGYAKASHISKLEVDYEGNRNSNSGLAAITAPVVNKVYTRQQLGAGTHTIKLTGSASLDTVFNDKYATTASKSITITVQEEITTAAVINTSSSDPNSVKFNNLDIPVTVSVIGEIINYTNTANVQSWKLYARKKEDAVATELTKAAGLSASGSFNFTITKDKLSGIDTYTQEFVTTARVYFKNAVRDPKTGNMVTYMDAAAKTYTQVYKVLPLPPEHEEDPPEPSNAQPEMIIKAKDTVLAGDEVTYDGRSSYDPDGSIVEWLWEFDEFEGIPVDSTTIDRTKAYYKHAGIYESYLTGWDNAGDSEYDIHTIRVLPPYPTARLTYSGTLKENRLITLSTTASTSPKYYPIDTTKNQVSIAAVSGGTSSDIKYSGSLNGVTSKQILVKKAGTYSTNYQATNTYPLSSSISMYLNIAPDLNPVADFTTETILLRDPKNASKAGIRIYDISYSPDGDYIDKRKIWLTWDSDNDGLFIDDTAVLIDDTSGKANIDAKKVIDYVTSNVGKYLVEIEVDEGFGQPTIPSFVLATDVKKDNTNDKPLSEKIIEVINTSPVIDFTPQKKKPVDIIVATDYTGTKLTNLQAALTLQKASLISKGIDANLTIVNTAKQVGHINDQLRWYRRYGRVSLIADYSSWADSERNRHFGLETKWEEVQKLESQYDSLPVRSPQNITWYQSGEWVGSTGSTETKFVTFTINCTNDVRSSGSVDFRTYYYHAGSTQKITNIEDVSASVDSEWQKEEAIQPVTTNVNSINFDNLNSISLREGSDRYALFITDNYQKDFTKAFGGYFPFGGLTNVQLDYIKNNGFTSYIVSPPKTVDSTLSAEQIIDCNISESFSFVKTMDGTIKSIGSMSSTIVNNEWMYPSEVNISSIKQICGDYVLQDDGVVKFRTGGKSYLTVSGVSGAVKIFDNYAITSDGCLYYMYGTKATDTGLDGIENIVAVNGNFLPGYALAVKAAGGTYALKNGVLIRSLHATYKAVKAGYVDNMTSPNFGDIAAVTMSNGAVYGLAEMGCQFYPLYANKYNQSTGTFSLVNMGARDLMTSEDGIAYSVLGADGTLYDGMTYDLEYRVGLFCFDFVTPNYTNVKKFVVTNPGTTAIVHNDGKVDCTILYTHYSKDGVKSYMSTIYKNVPSLYGKDIDGVWFNGGNGDNDAMIVHCTDGTVYKQTRLNTMPNYAVPVFSLIAGDVQAVYGSSTTDGYGNISVNYPVLLLKNNFQLTDVNGTILLSNVKKIDFNKNNLLVLTSDYKVYGVGYSDKGQLGRVIPAGVKSLTNIYNAFITLDQPGLNYITLRGILDNNYANKYFGSGQYQAAINDITNAYNVDPSFTSNYLLLGDSVDYAVIYDDYEFDPEFVRSWTFDHDPDYFDNSMGLHSQANKSIAAPVLTFDKTGKYIANVKSRDNPLNKASFDNYRLWSLGDQALTLYVHRRPLARFNFRKTYNASSDNYSLTITDKSLDLDHTSRTDKGITASYWYWKSLYGLTWTSGKPATLPAGGAYQIKLVVKDLEGVLSEPEVHTVYTDGTNNPPVADFVLYPNPLMKPNALTVTDNSFDPDGDPIAERKWTIKNSSGTVVYTGATLPTNYNTYTNGNYSVTLEVRDSPTFGTSLWSLPYSEVLVIKSDTTAPDVDADPISRPWLNTDVSTVITARDIDSGIANVKYRWTTTTAKPTSGWVTNANASFSVTQAAQGRWYLHMEATDKVGNSFYRYRGPYDIDKTAPTVDCTPTSKSGIAAYNLSVTAADTGGSGFKNVNYKLTNTTAKPTSGWTTTTSSSFTVPVNTDGTWYLHMESFDNAGNSYYRYRGPFTLDSTPPGIDADPESRDWLNTNVTAIITASDSDSGINNIKYRWTTTTAKPTTGWTTSASSSVAVTQATQGSWYLHMEATDKAGNTFYRYRGLYLIDKTNPSVDCTPATKSSNAAFNLSVTAADTGGSGLKEVRYKLTDSTAKPVSAWSATTSGSFTVPVNSDGTWYLHLESFDNAGNSYYRYRGPFTYISNLPPTIDIYDHTPKPAYIGDNVTLKMIIDDPDKDTLTLTTKLYNSANMLLATNDTILMPSGGIYSPNIVVSDVAGETYRVVATVSDGYLTASDTYNFAVTDLDITPNIIYNPAYAGERILLTADTSGQASAVVVDLGAVEPGKTLQFMPQSPITNNTNTWTNNTYIVPLTTDDGDYNVFFTEKRNTPNGVRSKTAMVVLKIRGNIYQLVKPRIIDSN